MKPARIQRPPNSVMQGQAVGDWRGRADREHLEAFGRCALVRGDEDQARDAGVDRGGAFGLAHRLEPPEPAPPSTRDLASQSGEPVAGGGGREDQVAGSAGGAVVGSVPVQVPRRGVEEGRSVEAGVVVRVRVDEDRRGLDGRAWLGVPNVLEVVSLQELMAARRKRA